MDDKLDQKNTENFEELSARIKSLEDRVSQMESQFIKEKSSESKSKINTEMQSKMVSVDDDNTIIIDDDELESNVIEYGFSWFGSIILVLGLAFLMTYLQNTVNSLASTVLGVAATAGVYFLANYLKKSFSYLSFMLIISSHLLLYYIVLRLYFFTSVPLIPIKGLVIIMLLAVLFIHLYQAVRRNSEFMAIIGVILSLLTAAFCDVTHITLPILTLTAFASLYLFEKQQWSVLLIITLISVYISHILWLFGNPLAGNPFAIRTFHDYSLIYLFSYGFAYTATTLLNGKESYKLNVFTSTIVINAIAFSFVTLLTVAAFFPNDYYILFLGISALCLGFSIFLKTKIKDQFVQSFYACCGFMALSASLYGHFKFPDAYFWLALQSFLVVSVALWYRSRIIVLMNTILFVLILLIYLLSSNPTDIINFTFAAVALISARIINWKKTRLTLETESIRNTYLSCLFFLILFGLYHAVPKDYVSISWTIAAILYFVFSVILRNIKYRYLSILTLISAGFYLFAVDLSKMTIGYRVVAFLFLAVISLGAAFYYVRKIKKNKEKETDTKIS